MAPTSSRLTMAAFNCFVITEMFSPWIWVKYLFSTFLKKFLRALMTFQAMEKISSKTNFLRVILPYWQQKIHYILEYHDHKVWLTLNWMPKHTVNHYSTDHAWYNWCWYLLDVQGQCKKESWQSPLVCNAWKCPISLKGQHSSIMACCKTAVTTISLLNDISIIGFYLVVSYGNWNIWIKVWFLLSLK